MHNELPLQFCQKLNLFLYFDPLTNLNQQIYRMKLSKRTWQILLPIVVIVLAAIITFLMANLRKASSLQEPVAIRPAVEVAHLTDSMMETMVGSHGSVHSRREAVLMARVSGTIDWVADAFAAGQRVEAGTVLLRLDSLPYASALAEAKGRKARAQRALAEENALASQAERDWRFVGQGEPDPLVLRLPQLQQARAELAAAEAALALARQQLADTQVIAPFAGTIREKAVDLGQTVTAQSTYLGRIQDNLALEVILPVTGRDWAFLPDAVDPVDSSPEGASATVRLAKRIGNREHIWHGSVDRIEAAVDPQTRLRRVFVRVHEPLTSSEGLQLTPGMFVSADIPGRRIEEGFTVPQQALIGQSVVYRVTADNRLNKVPVNVVRNERDRVRVVGDLQAGDRICLTPLLYFVEGMQVEVIKAPAAPAR